jgi:hypothetical protein
VQLGPSHPHDHCVCICMCARSTPIATGRHQQLSSDLAVRGVSDDMGGEWGQAWHAAGFTTIHYSPGISRTDVLELHTQECTRLGKSAAEVTCVHWAPTMGRRQELVALGVQSSVEIWSLKGSVDQAMHVEKVSAAAAAAYGQCMVSFSRTNQPNSMLLQLLNPAHGPLDAHTSVQNQLVCVVVC